MATAAAPAPTAVTDTPPAAGGGAKKIIILAVAGLVVGGGVGGFVIAPKLGGPADGAVVEHAPKPEPKVPAVVYAIENLVLNPANTNGGRFLLVTASIVVKDEAALTEMTERDAEVRDRIVGLLSSRTIEYLSDPTNRDALKTDLAAAVGALFEEGIVRRVLLPQFVIQ